MNKIHMLTKGATNRNRTTTRFDTYFRSNHFANLNSNTPK